MNVALVFAGGSGQRMKNSAKPKQFLELYGKPIIIYTLEVFERHPEIDAVVIPCIAGWENYLQRLLDKFGIKKVKKILTGGKDTQESKMIALRYLQTICKEDDIVLLHDAVRPLVTEKLITDNLAAVREYGNGITCVPFTETAIVSDDGKQIDRTIIRNTMYVAKAPQSFYFKDVLYAHEKGENMPYTITIDTCSLMTELECTGEIHHQNGKCLCGISCQKVCQCCCAKAVRYKLVCQMGCLAFYIGFHFLRFFDHLHDLFKFAVTSDLADCDRQCALFHHSARIYGCALCFSDSRGFAGQ